MPEIAEVQVFQKAYEVSKSTENTLVSGPKSELQRADAQGSITFPVRNLHT